MAAQHANKQVMVASVSKPLTAILTLRLLADTGVGVDTPIAQWLPSNWTLGDGQDAITFAQLMTHTSGLKQLNPTGVDYASLRSLVATDLLNGDGPYPYSYSNVNFALLRVLAAGLMGIDPVDYTEFESGPLTAAAFELYAQSVYGGIGVPASCSPTDPQPTLMYQWPLDGVSNGSESSDKVLVCGGYGFFISARQLAQVLVNLRYTDNLISDEQFDLMRDELFGFSPTNSGVGAYGPYYGHGGKWNPGMQSCVTIFPIEVEVAVTVNSIGGDYAAPCTEARIAFNNAWVAA